MRWSPLVSWHLGHPQPCVAAEVGDKPKGLGCLPKDTTMSNLENSAAYLLPRPVERLPDYAHAKARQSLAEKLSEAFQLSEAGASAIANAVVDPTEVRK